MRRVDLSREKLTSPSGSERTISASRLAGMETEPSVFEETSKLERAQISRSVPMMLSFFDLRSNCTFSSCASVERVGMTEVARGSVACKSAILAENFIFFLHQHNEKKNTMHETTKTNTVKSGGRGFSFFEKSYGRTKSPPHGKGASADRPCNSFSLYFNKLQI